MNIDDAVRVLNEHKFNGINSWRLDEDDDGDDVVKGAGWAMTPFVAIAIAEKLERDAGRDMPATRRLLKRLSDDAFHQNRAEKHSGYKWAEMASMIRRDELEAALAEWSYPNPSTETNS